MGAGHHHHHHGHGHAHDHVKAGRDNARRLTFTLVLQAAYLVAEVVGGYMANSLSLLADAGHMLSDVAALALSLFAVWIAQKPATARRTFGYYRTEILAALANAAALIAISIYIFYEAAQRLRAPEPVEGALVVWVALGGLLVNGIGAAALHGGREHSLNIRGAWLHLMTDAAGNVGVIAGGIMVWAWGLAWADPAMS
ncbi:MAG TPA: cation diffusion facilitator family transporter, partial [Longimicrobium sp.]|nr:cation diffusion facilitator family transporter [Longimicrobium sp.]